MRRTFEHDLPLARLGLADDELRLRFRRGDAEPAARARRTPSSSSARRSASALDEDGVFDEQASSARPASAAPRRVDVRADRPRLRQQGRAHRTPPRIAGAPPPDFAFVREFLAYFRAMGYPLLRASDYPRVDAFMAAHERPRRRRPARSGAPRAAIVESRRSTTSSSSSSTTSPSATS